MYWWIRLFRALLGFFGFLIVKITTPIFRFVYENKKQNISQVQSPLVLKSAIQLADMIRKRKATSEEVVSAFIARVKEANPMVNAIVATRFNEALEEARAVDSVLNSEDIPKEYSEINKPFLGVPFTAKEAFAIKGLPNTSGLLIRKNTVADRNADAVQLWINAGAIPIGVTNCSELCMWYESSNLLYGRTNNAYHQGRTVGGSSGGEGCILSVCGSTFGLGSDIGGSIRMPSFFNGIFGHKPTVGIVSNTGQFPNAKAEAQTFLSTGPMCKFATDLLPLLKILVKPQYSEVLQLDNKVNLSKLKCYYMLDDGGSFCSPVDPQIKEAIMKAVSHLEGSIGIPVNKISLNKLRYSFEIWSSKMTTSGDESFCSLLGNLVQPVNPYKEFLLWLFACYRHTLAAIGLGIVENLRPPRHVEEKNRGMCEALKNEFRQLLGDDGVFLYPTHPRVAPYHNQPLTLIPNFAYTAIFNVLGLPVTSVPMGISKEGVPIGIQVVGWQNNDRLTLAVAEELERAFGGWVPPF